MTVEAKLRISADLRDARTQVQALEADLRKMREAGIDSSNRGQYQNLLSSLRQVNEVVREQAIAQAQLQKATGKTSMQQLQLSAQLQDFFVQVQAGQSPLTAFIQQGSQLSFIYGGAANAFKAVLAIFTPLRLAIGGVAAVFGAFGLAAYQGAQQSAAFNKSLLLTGSYAGVTAGAVDAMAQRIRASVGVSIGGARETITALVATGRFSGSALEPLAIAIEKVSALTGTARDEVIQNFSKMADQGATKFAEEMNKSYNFLTLASYRHIKQLEDQGRAQEAMRVVSQALSEQLGSLTQNLGFVERAWNGIKLAASASWDAMLGIGRTETVEDKLAAALKRRAAVIASAGDKTTAYGQFNKGQADTSQIDAEIEQLKKTAFLQSRIKSDAGDRSELAKRQIEADKLINKTIEGDLSKQAKEAKALKDVREAAALAGRSPEDLAKAEAAIREQYKESGKAQQLTRLARAKEFYDADVELLNDANGRAQKLLQSRFDAGLVDLQSYLAEKARLQTDDAQQDTARLQTKLREEKRVLAENQVRALTAKDPNAKDQFAEGIVASKQKIAVIEAHLTKRERERLDNARALTLEGEKYTRDLVEQTVLFERQQRAASGQKQTPEQLRQNNFAQYKDLYDKLGVAGDAQGQQRVLQAVDDGARRDQFIQQERELGRLSAERLRAEEAVKISEAQGSTNASQAERQILQIRREQVPALRAIAAELSLLANSPDEKARVAQADLELKRLDDQRTEASKLVNNEARSGFQTLFTDIASGSKTAGQALGDMVSGFAKKMLDLIAQNLFADLFKPVSGADGGGGFDLGKIFTGLLGFHSGGVVRSGSETFTRQIPLGLAQAAASFAPRYHTGGIAGFKPNERLAVLEQGEEVLTAKDPRHAANYKPGTGGLGGMQVTTNIAFNGAPDQKERQEQAGQGLQQAILNVVDSWAINQMRPGGVLAK